MTTPRTDLVTALRSLDPAHELETLTLDPRSPGPDAALERIIASDPAPSRLAGERRTPSRRLLVGGVIVATTTVAAVVLPQFYGGNQAFATWTASPSGLTKAEAAETAENCRKELLDGGTGYSAALRASQPALAERRGAWSLVVLADDGGFSALCVRDESAVSMGGMFGGLGTPTDFVTSAPREIDATDLGSGGIDGESLSLAVGHAGSEVTAVVAHTRTHGDVEATVSGGRYALWFPGDEWNDDTARDGVDLEVTYSDGTSATQRVAP